MGAMKRLLEEIKEAMGDAYDMMLAEEYQASLTTADTSKGEIPPDTEELPDGGTQLRAKESEE